MSDRDRGDDRDEELAALLADLERTLSELRVAVEADLRGRDEGRDERATVSRGGGDAGPTPRRRPPTPGEVLRFTEEYTIPTLVSLLEATVQSLELLRAVLRLAGPRPDDSRLADRLDASRGPDAESLREAVAGLRDALTGTDLPADSEARSILSDARALSAEIEERLVVERDDVATADDGRGEQTASGVDIAVREEADEGDDRAEADVDAELASLKESMADETDEE
jgi:hypothetical protein